jgi:hypothetical protein
MVLKIINIFFLLPEGGGRRGGVVRYVPHVSIIELLVATTHLKQAETKERNDRQRKVCANKIFYEVT